MARDPLQVLLRLRGITLDATRRALGERLREAAAAEQRAASVAAEIARETAAAASPAEPVAPAAPAVPMVDSYAAWLRRAQETQRSATQAVRTAATATAKARDAVNDARAARRALEVLLEHAAEARRKEAEHANQQALDEAAAQRTRRGQWSG